MSTRVDAARKSAASKLKEAEKEVNETNRDVQDKMDDASNELRKAARDVEGSSSHDARYQKGQWQSEDDRAYFEKVHHLRHHHQHHDRDSSYDKRPVVDDEHTRRDQMRAREFDQSMHNAKEQVKQSAQDTVEYVGDKIEPVVDATKDAANTVVGKLSAAGDYVAEKAHNAKEATKSAAKRVVDELSQPVTSAKAHIMDAKDKISQTTDELHRDFHETVEQRRAREAREEAVRRARAASTSTTTTTSRTTAATSADARTAGYQSRNAAAVRSGAVVHDPAYVREQVRPAERCSNFDVKVDCERTYTFAELRDMVMFVAVNCTLFIATTRLRCHLSCALQASCMRRYGRRPNQGIQQGRYVSGHAQVCRGRSISVVVS